MAYVAPPLRHIPEIVRVRPGLYRAPGGREIHSVTRILGATHDDDFKQAIGKWRATVGDAGADYVTNRGAARGTLLHDAIEAVLCGDAPAGEVPPLIDKFLGEEVGHIWGCEVPLVHRTLPYAGTADLVAFIRGCMRVADWKTSTKLPTWRSVAKYDVQIAAYAHALESWGLPRPAGFVLVQPDAPRGSPPGTWAKPVPFELPPDRIEQALQEFLARLDDYTRKN